MTYDATPEGLKYCQYSFYALAVTGATAIVYGIVTPDFESVKVGVLSLMGGIGCSDIARTTRKTVEWHKKHEQKFFEPSDLEVEVLVK